MIDDDEDRSLAAKDELVTKRPGSAERSPRAPKPAAHKHLERGTLIGRYIILDTLGEGGMGVVYSAFDPELERKVAIKLLQGKPGGSQPGEDQAWLLREAQALARLAHPNVVAVHDVGTLGDRVFVAMELVDGLTLRQWLADGPRSYREVLPVMIAAGQGLAAAHAAGLVHRDFKPENVLVGRDGRVRVMDFGLARLRVDEPAPRSSDLELGSKSPLSETLTVPGLVVGTPAYMAPELAAGGAADTVTDQFAYGVTLCEALFGSRPFKREHLGYSDATPPKPKLSEGAHVPPKIQRVVLRAIALDPAQRYPTLDTLLAELAIDPVASRRRVLVAAGAVALVAVGVATFALRSGTPAPCQGIDERIADVWNAPAKAKIRESFAATKRPYAPQAFAHLERAIDRYTAEWTTTAVDSCRATRVRRDQTEEVLSLRQACLDQRLDELRALTRLLGESAANVVDKAEKIASELQPLAACSNVAVLRGPGTPAPELKPKLVPINKQLAEATANMIAGRYLPGLVAAQKAADQAGEVGYDPLLAEALVLRATALIANDNIDDAVAVYRAAIWAAVRGKRDDLAAMSSFMLAMVTSDRLGRPVDAKIWLEFGEAITARAGLHLAVEHRRFTAAGMIAAQLGDNAAAVEAHQKAFAAAQRTAAPGDPGLWADELVLATTLTKANVYRKAVEHLEHAMALREATVGRDHTDIAIILTNLGNCYSHLGEGTKARAAFQRALAIRELAYGKRHPLLVPTLNNYADYLKLEGDFASALPLIERAVQIAEKIPGKEHASYHHVATTYAEVLGGSGRLVQARTLFDELIAAEVRLASTTMPITLAARAELEIRERAWPAATQFAEQAIAAFEKAGGVDNPELVGPLVTLARARIGVGKRDEAKPLLQRALAIGAKVGMGDHELKAARDALAAIE